MKNLKPQAWVSIALGGELQGLNHDVITDRDKYFNFSL